MKILQIDEVASLKRSIDAGTSEQQSSVKKIIADVRRRGDSAIAEYTHQFDHVKLSSFAVDESEIEEAYKQFDDQFVEIVREAAENIKSFHEKQLRPSWMTTEENGTILGQKITALDSVGVYVPGGTAAYPSSVLMNVIPAKVAGVKRIAMVSPPNE
ncbi:MAG: histidinol dehydrogenase, partial [Bacillota bacterium]|nr:histidinol dehydrogenase [Bacillota bacterium]